MVDGAPPPPLPDEVGGSGVAGVRKTLDDVMASDISTRGPSTSSSTLLYLTSPGASTQPLLPASEAIRAATHPGLIRASLPSSRSLVFDPSSNPPRATMRAPSFLLAVGAPSKGPCRGPSAARAARAAAAGCQMGGDKHLQQTPPNSIAAIKHKRRAESGSSGI